MITLISSIKKIFKPVFFVINFKSNMQSVTLGIDFGATKIVTAVYGSGAGFVANIVHDQNNDRISKTCVAFTDKERLFTEAAVSQASTNPENTIFGRDIKYIMMNDDTFRNSLIPVVKDSETSLESFVVHYKSFPIIIFPEQALSMLLLKVRMNAECTLGQKIDKCVITMGSNQGMFKPLKTACKAAQMKLCQVISSATASAFTYSMEQLPNDVQQQHLLIFDMGATSLDVSICQVKHGGSVKIIASEVILGRLGGDRFTDQLKDYFLKEINQKLKQNLNKIQLARLWNGCEEVKKVLSTQTSAKFTIESFNQQKPYDLIITQEKFEELCQHLFKDVQEVIQNVIGKVQEIDIDHVIIVGSGAQILKLLQIVKTETGKEPRVLSQVEAMAKGAAYYAKIVNDVSAILITTKINNVRLKEIVEQERRFLKDEKNRETILRLKNELEKLCYSYKRGSESQKIKEKSNEILQWLTNNRESEDQKQMNDKAVELQTAHYQIDFFKGWELFDQNDFAAAVASFNKFTERCEASKIPINNFFQMFLLRGLSYYKIKEYKNAIEDLTAALKIHGQNDEEILLARYRRAICYYKLNEFTKAINDIEEVLVVRNVPELQRKLNIIKVEKSVHKANIASKNLHYSTALRLLEEVSDLVTDELGATLRTEYHVLCTKLYDAQTNVTKVLYHGEKVREIQGDKHEVADLVQKAEKALRKQKQPVRKLFNKLLH